MAQLFLVRHAQASFGAENYDELSALGHEQSSLLGEYFAQRQQEFDLLVTGALKRQIQTSEGILKHTKAEHIYSDSCWDEFDFDLIVRTYLTHYPKQKPSPNAPRSEWYKVLRNAMIAWSKSELDITQGETWQAFCCRVEQGMQQIKESRAKRVLVVSSGGTMAIFLKTLLNTSVEQAVALNLQIKNTSLNEFFFNKNGFQLSCFNHVPHLDNKQHQDKITYS
ncbi:histidine phosphatase family protein [Glaciecola petra]|uniref:Histidine phosphatase family protein n=1 Tax=Glaciecola petra TaxID=3075602 RepID=A0ABU2ZN79_9ALTE|nr:histidine phosphatase family protein [Aestuariibacter sp. P117]MDT0594074.1 histidine phosphatase family protein [Aestuariibacter sp. P117]